MPEEQKFTVIFPLGGGLGYSSETLERILQCRFNSLAANQQENRARVQDFAENAMAGDGEQIGEYYIIKERMTGNIDDVRFLDWLGNEALYISEDEDIPAPERVLWDKLQERAHDLMKLVEQRKENKVAA